jgi:hypothetical protein
MINQNSSSSEIVNNQPKARRSLLGGIRRKLRLGALALPTLLLPCSLLASPTIVRIDATQPGPPTTQVFRSQEYNLYLGPEVSDANIEYGGLVDLLGVDNVYNGGGQIADREWRFTDPRAPDQTHSAVYIVWIDHDYGDSVNGYYGPLFSGDLRVGFNEHKPGGYYTTVNAAPIKNDKWLTLYSDAHLVLQFKGSLLRR